MNVGEDGDVICLAKFDGLRQQGQCRVVILPIHIAILPMRAWRNLQPEFIEAQHLHRREGMRQFGSVMGSEAHGSACEALDD